MLKKTSLRITVVVYVLALVFGYVTYVLVPDSWNLFEATLAADVVMTLFVFACSVRYNNSSLYDPYWSVIPIFLVLFWIVELDQFSVTAMAVWIGVLLWGVRLTHNWYLNFQGYVHEDFRYVDFRTQFKSWYWLISLVGIHLFPTLIVYSALYPLYFILSNPVAYPVFVFVGTAIMIGGAWISFIADNQLRAHKAQSPGVSINRGLWNYSRHPNYFGEVTFWFGAYVASLSVGIALYPALGFIGMWILFNFYSVPKMEQKLLRNKEDYQSIIDTVPRFFFRKPKADQ